MWVASSEWTKDVVISETVVNSVHNALDKYRLTVKMLLGMLADFDPSGGLVPYEQMSQLDQIAMLHLHAVCTSVRKAFADLEFHKAANALYRWIATDLSSFYFEAIKDVIYCDRPTSARRMSAQTALHHIFRHLQNMLAPITPLLVEESWEHSSEAYKRGDHPLKRVWQAPPEEWNNPTLEHLIPTLMSINSSVKVAQEHARTSKLMGQSLASDVLIILPQHLSSLLSLQTLQEILVVSKVDVINNSDDTLLGDREWTRSSDIHGPDDHLLGRAVVASPRGHKCSRCWKYNVVEVEPQEAAKITGVGEERHVLCRRCVDAVAEFQ